MKEIYAYTCNNVYFLNPFLDGVFAVFTLFAGIFWVLSAIVCFPKEPVFTFHIDEHGHRILDNVDQLEPTKIKYHYETVKAQKKQNWLNASAAFNAAAAAIIQLALLIIKYGC